MIKTLITVSLILSIGNAKSNKSAYMEYLNSKNKINQVQVSYTKDSSISYDNNLVITDQEEINLVPIEQIEVLEEDQVPQIEKIEHGIAQNYNPGINTRISIDNNMEDKEKNINLPYIRENSVPQRIEPMYNYQKPVKREIVNIDTHTSYNNKNILVSVAAGAGYLHNSNDSNIRDLASSVSFKVGKNFDDIQVSLEYLKNRTRDHKLKRKTYLLNIDKTFYNSKDIDLYAGVSIGQGNQEISTLEEDSFVYGINLGQRFKINDDFQAVAGIKALKEDFTYNKEQTHDYSLNAGLGLNILF